MKNLIAILLFGLFFTSCAKELEPEDICTEELTCIDEECVFTINNARGNTMYLSCFDKWGIYAENAGVDDSNVWLIVEDWDSSYEADSIDITFCGYVLNNHYPLILPDPAIGPVYAISLEAVAKN